MRTKDLVYVWLRHRLHFQQKGIVPTYDLAKSKYGRTKQHQFWVSTSRSSSYACGIKIQCAISWRIFDLWFLTIRFRRLRARGFVTGLYSKYGAGLSTVLPAGTGLPLATNFILADHHLLELVERVSMPGQCSHDSRPDVPSIRSQTMMDGRLESLNKQTFQLDLILHLFKTWNLRSERIVVYFTAVFGSSVNERISKTDLEITSSIA